MGIVKQIVHIPTNKSTFIVVHQLEQSGNKLCSDYITNASIDSHIMQFHPPSMLSHLIAAYTFQKRSLHSHSE